MDQTLVYVVFYVALLAIAYMFFIRPNVKKAKEQGEFISKIEKGDRVVTTGGIHGRVARLDDNGQVLVEVDSNVKIRMERSAISQELTKAAYGTDKNGATADEKK